MKLYFVIYILDTYGTECAVIAAKSRDRAARIAEEHYKNDNAFHQKYFRGMEVKHIGTSVSKEEGYITGDSYYE